MRLLRCSPGSRVLQTRALDLGGCATIQLSFYLRIGDSSTQGACEQVDVNEGVSVQYRYVFSQFRCSLISPCALNRNTLCLCVCQYRLGAELDNVFHVHQQQCVFLHDPEGWCEACHRRHACRHHHAPHRLIRQPRPQVLTLPSAAHTAATQIR